MIMNEEIFFKLSIGWTILAIALFPILLKIKQPYGRHTHKGWGLLMGGSAVNPFSMKAVFADQGFTVVITRQITGSEEKPEIMDREVEALQTDLHELITHLSSNTVWAYTTGVIDVHIASTDPIEYYNDEKFRMISSSAHFVAKIEEDLD